MIRDRVVCGINDDAIQKRLLAEGEKLTLAKALSLAQSYEAAVKDAATLLPDDTQQIHRVTDAAAGRTHSKKPCYRCTGIGHSPGSCRFRKERCHNCHKIGHIKKACKQGLPTRNVQYVDQTEPPTKNEYPLFTISVSQSTPIVVSVRINSKSVNMELDTGAAVSLISQDTYHQHWPQLELEESNTQLKTYSGEFLETLGRVNVDVCYGEQQMTLPLVIVKGKGPSLFGRNWLERIKLDWPAIHRLQEDPLENVLHKHAAVFEDTLGTLQGFKAQVRIDSAVAPKFCKARTVPYAYRAMVDAELDKLVEQGILTPVQFSDWAAPIVPVLKSDKKSVRICGDFKKTVNQASKVDKYPIPKIEDLFSSLAGGKAFTTLDMSQAYQQVLLDEPSRKLVVINTSKGLFQYNRLPFGISCAPGIFQRIMESLLKGIPGVVVYLDDILVTGPSEEEHLSSLKQVLTRLQEAGLRLNRKKCKFLSPAVTYLGYRIDSEGLHPTEQKLKAVQLAPEPTNVTELKAYIGLLTYYGRFLPHRPSVLAPLYVLLQTDTPWRWTPTEQEAFNRSKELLTSSTVVVHFNPELPIILACDASAYGVGAVLAHKMPDGSERPVGFASRTLSKAEKGYSQIEKEGLSCVFGVTKFHAYLMGRHFTLITDHKPLLGLLNENKPIPSHASARIQRWAFTLAAYEYALVSRRTNAHGNADALSRLPLVDTIQETPLPAEFILALEQLNDAPVTHEQIQAWTVQSPVLRKVSHFIQQGWPSHCDQPELKPYWSRQTELSCFEGCILWGTRVLVPPQGRQRLLEELHIGHPGMSRMKALARTVIWWPKLDMDIEEMVKGCNECQLTRSMPPAAPLNPLPWPTKPWSHIHIDFAGPFMNHMFLIIIDAGSKWIEAFPMLTSTSKATIQHLKTLFSQFGLPDILVSDNGSCFTSAEFQDFLLSNGIKHWKSAPYHPSSNGLAEKAVQIVKQGLKRMKDGTINDKLSRLLFSYRITPHSTTGVSPGQLMMGRNLKTRFDLLKPDLVTRVEQKQQQQKKNHDAHAVSRQFLVEEEVYVRDFRQGHTWLQGKIVKCSGPVSYKVKLDNGQVIRRHEDHLRRRSTPALILTDDIVDTPNVERAPNQPRRNPPHNRRCPNRYT